MTLSYKRMIRNPQHPWSNPLLDPPFLTYFLIHPSWHTSSNLITSHSHRYKIFSRFYPIYVMVSIMVIGVVKFVVMVEVMIMIMIMVIFMVIIFVIVINIFFVMVKIIVISMVIIIVLVMIMVIYYDPPPSYHINPFKPHSALPSGNSTLLSSRPEHSTPPRGNQAYSSLKQGKKSQFLVYQFSCQIAI